MVGVVDDERSADEAGRQEREQHQQAQTPGGGGHGAGPEDLELRVEVQRQEEHAREHGGGVAAGEARYCVPEVGGGGGGVAGCETPVPAGADGRRVHDALVPRASTPTSTAPCPCPCSRSRRRKRDIRTTAIVEMRAQPPHRPLQDDLERGRGEHGSRDAEEGGVGVPEAADDAQGL